MSKVGNCKRCGAPQGPIGWLCDHSGNKEHDNDVDWASEAFAQRMEKKKGTDDIT